MKKIIKHQLIKKGNKKCGKEKLVATEIQTACS